MSRVPPGWAGSWSFGEVTLDSNGLPQVSQGVTGTHLSWTGPSAWVHAPDGFTVQRRVAERLGTEECERFDATRIAHLVEAREQPLVFGVITFRVLSANGDGGGLMIGPGRSFMVFGIDFDEVRRLVRIATNAACSATMRRFTSRQLSSSCS